MIERPAHLTEQEDGEQHMDDETEQPLPVFRVYPHCVMAEDCCDDECIYKIDKEANRAVILQQPRNEEELEFHREMAEACPVSAIREATSWEELPTEEEARPEDE